MRGLLHQGSDAKQFEERAQALSRDMRDPKRGEGRIESAQLITQLIGIRQAEVNFVHPVACPGQLECL